MRKGYSSAINVIAVIILVVVVVFLLILILKSNLFAMSERTKKTVENAPSDIDDVKNKDVSGKFESDAQYVGSSKSGEREEALAKTIALSNKNEQIAGSSSTYLRSSSGKCGCYIVSCCLAEEVIN